MPKQTKKIATRIWKMEVMIVPCARFRDYSMLIVKPDIEAHIRPTYAYYLAATNQAIYIHTHTKRNIHIHMYTRNVAQTHRPPAAAMALFSLRCHCQYLQIPNLLPPHPLRLNTSVASRTTHDTVPLWLYDYHIARNTKHAARCCVLYISIPPYVQIDGRCR